MKIGNIDGSPEEIKNFFANSGLNLADFLEKPKSKPKIKWFIFPVILIILSLSLMLFLGGAPKNILTCFFLLGFAGVIWLAVYVQIHFNNLWATAFVGVGGLLMLLIGAGLLSPIDTLKVTKDLLNK